jgi:excisionase family DNA binding protein
MAHATTEGASGQGPVEMMDALRAQEDMVSQGMLKMKEVAEFLGISKSEVYNMVAEGRLPYVPYGRTGKAKRVPRKAVIDYAARNLVSATV